ncbi:MAG: esterase/lipase family protein [Terrimicrobiaceae bacterium]
MKYSRHLLAALLALTVLGTGCKNYATVRDRKPIFVANTPAGEKIVQALKRPERTPEVQMGRFIDAAAVAAKVLEKNPKDAKALRDYNFAVSRLFDVLYKSDLKPWRAPVICPGADGNWSFTVLTDGKPEHDPSNFRIMAADRFQFRGSLVRERTVKEGLGAPMVIASKGFDPTKFDPFIQGKNVYYGITQILRFNGRNVTAAYVDPLATEDVKFGGHTFPVAADFTAPIALALAELRPRRVEVKRMFDPGSFAASTRLARLQPYDPKKIPVICIHGLGDSQATWAPMIESLRGDAVFRKNYQIWFFSYPTGLPYPLMAAVLRKKIDEINKFYPDHKPFVLIGHSMGGMISRVLITDSGDKIWNAFFETPPDKTPLSPKARAIITETLIFKHRPEVDRVIFASASLRGAEMASSFMGRLGSAIISVPSQFTGVGRELAELSKMRADGKRLRGMPTSIDALDPRNRFVTTINTIPVVKGIPYHSIMGDRGRGGYRDHRRPQSSDGIVPFWSSHIEGAESELIVAHGHWTNQNPKAIAEVNRILRQHLKETSR